MTDREIKELIKENFESTYPQCSVKEVIFTGDKYNVILVSKE